MFETILGQDDAINAMKNALNRPVNTYVFYGSSGTFVDESARLFASQLIDETGESQDRVTKCLHPDVIEFVPAGINYKVKEDVRDSMLVELRKTPIEGNKKVLIVHDAHLLRKDSANTLLKSLEEPPEQIHWILIAPSTDTLIPTIRSRCYEITFSRLGPEIINKLLIQNGINEAKAQDISTKCSGRLDRALKLCTIFQPINTCAKEIVLSNELSASHVSKSAQMVVETFNEIETDVIANHKKEIDEIKKSVKESGYSDQAGKIIITTNKKRMEANEKKLRREMLIEFLDALQVSISAKERENSNLENEVYANEIITEYRNRLIYNPSEQLFIESLLSAITLHRLQVKS